MSPSPSGRRPRTMRPDPRVVEIATTGVRLPVAQRRLVALAQDVLRALRVPRATLSVAFVSARQIAKLHRTHLGHAGPTDIITFALGHDPNGAIIGDIYICLDVAREQARTHGVRVRDEVARLVVHGTLHACGWEHPDDASRTSSPMWRRQEQLLQRFWMTPSPAA
jgi:probable rRNA maturation factor